MAEAAGLALSVIALFSSCVQGYGALRTMRDQGSEASTCLEIEERRLVLWSRSAGLFDDTCLIPTSDLDTVISTLRQIEVITQDAGTLRTRYRLKDDTPAEDGEVRAPIRYIIGGPELSPSQVSGEGGGSPPPSSPCVGSLTVGSLRRSSKISER